MKFFGKEKDYSSMDEYDLALLEAKKHEKRRKIWRFCRPIAMVLLSMGIVVAILAVGWNFVEERFLKPIESDQSNLVTVEIKSGWGVSKIANALYGTSEEDQLIRSKAVFKIYVDFVGKGRKLRAGTYIFAQGDSIEEIVNKIAGGESEKEKVLRFTLTEGMTVEDMAETLVREGILANETEFLRLCKTGEGLDEYEIPELSLHDGRQYRLEGYLFPDTYEVFEGSSAKDIIARMLMRRSSIMEASYYERMQELELTEDDVITLASMIEKEAQTKDFSKVSGVFYNRIEEDMPLQSDATIIYVLGTSKINLTKSELETDSPYNTHLNKGLPAGPICNPGKAAIEAALFPDESIMEEGYLYFTLKEPASGDLVFSKTLEEHNAQVELYRELWEDYDREQGLANQTASPSESPSLPSVSAEVSD